MKGTTNGSRFKEINEQMYEDVLCSDGKLRQDVLCPVCRSRFLNADGSCPKCKAWTRWDITDDTLEPITKVCSELSKFLLHKNKNYGDSAREPLRIFSSSDPSDGMLVRMDDKLSRIKNSSELRRNDVVDLLGYLVLYCTSVGWTDFSDMID